jgi:long-chain fatty acid transport protein
MRNVKNVLYRGLIILTMLLMLDPSGYAENGIKMLGYGPVQRSMGGASVGLPLDTATIITNPAGMHDAGKRMDIDLTIAVPISKYNATSDFVLSQVLRNGDTLSSDAGVFLIPGFGITYPFNENIAAGIGAYGTSGIGTKYERNLYRNITYVESKALRISPALSFSFFDNGLSFGAAANIDYATLDFEAAGPGQWAHRDGWSVGGGYTLGMLVKPVGLLNAKAAKDFMSIGVSYISEQTFAPFEYDTDLGKDKLQLDQPRSVNVGIGMRPDKKLRMAFDIEWINWNHVLGKNQPEYRENFSNAAAWNVKWNNQSVYKLGVEYDLFEKMIVEKLTLRAGYNYGKHPLRQDRPFEGIALPAITEHHITCGIGADLIKNMAVNVGFTYAPAIKLYMSNVGDFIDHANITTSAWSLDTGISLKF